MGILERIDVRDILNGHFATLYDARTKKPYWMELGLFYILPLSIIVFQCLLKARIGSEASNVILQIFAIAGGFLVSSLFIIVDRKNITPDNDTSKALAEETYFNVSFGVLLCFITVMLCILNHFFLSLVTPPAATDWLGPLRNYLSIGFALSFISGLIYYLSWLFTYNILMVLKRLNALFKSS